MCFYTYIFKHSINKIKNVIVSALTIFFKNVLLKTLKRQLRYKFNSRTSTKQLKCTAI